MIVIGVGNELRHDDGAGPAVISELRSRSVKDVTLVATDGEPARLIDLWDGADLTVVIDAVPSESTEPGRVRELESIAARQEVSSVPRKPMSSAIPASMPSVSTSRSGTASKSPVIPKKSRPR